MFKVVLFVGLCCLAVWALPAPQDAAMQPAVIAAQLKDTIEAGADDFAAKAVEVLSIAGADFAAGELVRQRRRACNNGTRVRPTNATQTVELRKRRAVQTLIQLRADGESRSSDSSQSHELPPQRRARAAPDAKAPQPNSESASGSHEHDHQH